MRAGDVELNEDVQGVIAQFVGMRGAGSLRLTCKQLRDIVARVALVQWRSTEALRGSQLRPWRACFPGATAANVSSAKDEDLQWLGGVTTLNLWGCDLITDEGLRHLGSVTTLNLSDCSLITDEGLRHLGSVTTLDLTYCFKITDAGRASRRGGYDWHNPRTGCPRWRLSVHRGPLHLGPAALPVLEGHGAQPTWGSLLFVRDDCVALRRGLG
jgi:hypothetical protein